MVCTEITIVYGYRFQEKMNGDTQLLPLMNFIYEQGWFSKANEIVSKESKISDGCVIDTSNQDQIDNIWFWIKDATSSEKETMVKRYIHPMKTFGEDYSIVIGIEVANLTPGDIFTPFAVMSRFPLEIPEGIKPQMHICGGVCIECGC